MINVTKKLREFLANQGYKSMLDATDDVVRNAASQLLTLGTLTVDSLKEMTEVAPTHSTEKVLGNVRVKEAAEGYETTKSLGTHAKTGKPVIYCGKPVEMPSQLELAKIGVLVKLHARRGGMPIQLNDHDQQLLHKMFAEDTWIGSIGNEYGAHSGLKVKALLSDSVSGGVDLNPEWFDSAIIQFPLLHSQIFPFVDQRDMPRGSVVEGASVDNPTVNWGPAEGTEMPLFDTDDMVGEIGASVFPLQCAIEIGRDLLADSPAEIGRIVQENMGQAMAKDLDRVVCVGNGTSEPEGIFTASGTIAVTADNGGSGPPTVDDYLSLLFAIGMQYRNSAMGPAFLSNDTAYSRAAGIQVAPASDQRLVFGMDVESYGRFGWPHRICNDIPNTKIAFGALKRYRMWKRQGMEMRVITEDKELALANKQLMICRARFAGRVIDPSAFSIITNAQT